MGLRSQPEPAASSVRVALPLPLPHTFDYLASETPLAPGVRVRVPFGRGQRVGIVVGTSTQPVAERLKSIGEVLDVSPLLDAELLANLCRAADYWCGAIGEDVLGALPLA
jgi:primosomal protein N' (replication factor Y)